MRHVKNQWIQDGCDPEDLKSDILERVLKGLKRWLPPKKDTRPAFLLPHYKIPAKFRHPASGKLCTSMAAVIFGFFGLTRFHVLEKMNIDSLSLVDGGDGNIKYTVSPKQIAKGVIFGEDYWFFL